jgi:RNA polymerase sigma-70 factor (ECF subfamily)
MEDAIAITRLKQGDMNGLESLVERYQAQAVQAANFILRDRPRSEEAVQTAFVLIAERIHQFDDTRPFAPWFFRIVLHEALKTAQRQNRFVPLEVDPDDDASALARWFIDPLPSPEALLEIQESRKAIQAALGCLQPQQRAVVVMRYFLDMSEAEMSVKLDRPASTIKWWLRAARERLRNLLRPLSN